MRVKRLYGRVYEHGCVRVAGRLTRHRIEYGGGKGGLLECERVFLCQRFALGFTNVGPVDRPIPSVVFGREHDAIISKLGAVVRVRGLDVVFVFHVNDKARTCLTHLVVGHLASLLVGRSVFDDGHAILVT